jgi:hypothetical protein
MGLIVAAMVLAGSAAQADEGLYTEIGLVPMRFSAGGDSLTPEVAVLRLGYAMSKNFALEATAATTVQADSSGRTEFKVDNALGGYLKGTIELARNLELFAKLGVVRTQLSAGGLGSASDHSVSYAAGLQYHFSKKFYGQIDYASYYDRDGLRATGPSLSLGIRF